MHHIQYMMINTLTVNAPLSYNSATISTVSSTIRVLNVFQSVHVHHIQ